MNYPPPTPHPGFEIINPGFGANDVSKMFWELCLFTRWPCIGGGYYYPEGCVLLKNHWISVLHYPIKS